MDYVCGDKEVWKCGGVEVWGCGSVWGGSVAEWGCKSIDEKGFGGCGGGGGGGSGVGMCFGLGVHARVPLGVLIKIEYCFGWFLQTI